MTLTVDFHADEKTFIRAINLSTCEVVCITITKGGDRELNLYFTPEQAKRFSEDLAIAVHKTLADDAEKNME